MDTAVLTYDITRTLTPLLRYLLKPGDKAAEEAGKKLAGDKWNQAKELWAILEPRIKAKPTALEAVRDVAGTPDDEDAQAALRFQLKKIVTEDEALAKTLLRVVEESRSASRGQGSGERSVAIGGDVTGAAIITGDSNIISDR